MIMQIHNSEHSLQTDLYELTMAAGYFHNKVDLTATFELSCHTMPRSRSYLVACGLEQAVDYVLNLRFSDEDILFLKSLPVFKNMGEDFFEYLRWFQFTGNLWAMPEGEIFFAREPIIQIEAPIIEAQILETYLLSIMNIESLVATKAARIVQAACSDHKERDVIDFGSRRAHGPEAGVLSARAAYIGGCVGTSNVLAGEKFNIPVYGTVAHSWVEAFNQEVESFYKYYAAFPDHTTLLIDTYDTIEAVKKIVNLEIKDKIRGVRLDSGDLNILSKKVRMILDKAGLNHVKIIASGNLDEHKILELIKESAPIDAFGVGTELVSPQDCPNLDLVYKLVQTCDGLGNIRFTAKKSKNKETIPGKKQVFRYYTKNMLLKKDVLGLSTGPPIKDTQPLLKQIIKNGHLTEELPATKELRTNARNNFMRIPGYFLNFKNISVYEVINSLHLNSNKEFDDNKFWRRIYG